MAETLRDLMYGAALRSQPMTQPPMLLPDTIQRLTMQQGGTIGAPQRSTLAQMLGNTGTAAQRLAAALDQYGVRVPGTQARITLKDLTLGDAGQVVEDMSYGMPPTTGGNYATGGIGTMGVQPRAMDLLNLGGVAGGTVKAGQMGARVLGPTLRDMTRQGADNAARAMGARLSIVPEAPAMKMQPDTFMEYVEPVHSVRDLQKLSLLVKDMRENGWQGRPILALENDGAAFALTGSHRIAAAKQAGIKIPVVYVDDAATQTALQDGSFLMDNIGIGDDKMADLLRQLGDDRAARLMDWEYGAQ